MSAKCEGGEPKEREKGPQRKIDQSVSVCDSSTAWHKANSCWPYFDSGPLNDMWEALSCLLLRKHMIRCPYLIHDKSHLPGLERAQHKTAVRGERAKGQKVRHSLADPGKQTKKLPPLKSHVQSYFIQTSTAITVSSHRQSECVISSIFLKADSLTIIEDPLLFWQPKSCHWGSVWVFQASLNTHFCHYFPLPSLSLHMFLCSSLSESTPLSPHNNSTS